MGTLQGAGRTPNEGPSPFDSGTVAAGGSTHLASVMACTYGRTMSIAHEASGELGAREAAERSIAQLEDKFKDRLVVNPDLSRNMVSFQANKSEPIFRWFHYREGFSRQLIDYVISSLELPQGGSLMDPFAGTGASVFVASETHGMSGIAFELLPVGTFFMNCRQLFRRLGSEKLLEFANRTLINGDWQEHQPSWQFPHLRITSGAFTLETQTSLERFCSWALSQQDSDYSSFLRFVAFSVLERISFTRKDGQYLRWDHRSPRYQEGRRQTTFDKGEIPSFEQALSEKLHQIIDDCTESPIDAQSDEPIKVVQGSVMRAIEGVADNSVDCVITSPPYCNRYDYTRTYALELAFLGVTEDAIRSLRQDLLTCTVENKPKQYEYLSPEVVRRADEIMKSLPSLTETVDFLIDEREAGRLNNRGIVTMVHGYFYDSTVHLIQAAEKLKTSGVYVMVNDNVRYNGLDVPVDLILSSIAEQVGLETEVIWVLPRGKGNSSQQMKKHGRSELRKCVYVWRKA